MIRFFLLLLLLPFPISYYFNSPSDMDPTIIGFLLFIAALAVGIFSTKEEKEDNLKKQYLKHSTILIISFSIVHFQYSIDFLLGNTDESNLYIWVRHDVVIKSLSLAVAGLISFLMGYLAYRNKSNFTKSAQQANTKNVSVRLLSYVAAILLGAYFYYANPLYLMGFYGSEDVGSEASYLILLFKAVAFAVLIQTAGNFQLQGEKASNFLTYVKSNNFLVNILIGIYLISVIISGDRGPILAFCVAYFGCYLYVTKHRFNIFKTVVLLLLGAIFVTLLGDIRSLDKEMSFSKRFSESLTSSGDRFSTESFLPQTQELASSIRTLHHTVGYIPESHDYLYGRFQLQQILVIVPFGSNIIRLIFDDTSYKYTASSRFVTWINKGDYPTSGDGTSIIADFYFDFGLIGVLLGMLIFGYIIRYAEISMYSRKSPSLFSQALFIVFLSSAVHIPRSTFLVEFKVVVWTFAVLYINQKINKKS